MKKTCGATKNLTYKYNQLVTEEYERRKSQNGSKGEMLEKIGSM